MEAVGFECALESLGHALRVHEDHGAASFGLAQQANQQGNLFLHGRVVHELAHAIDRHFVGLDAHQLRVVHVLVGELEDPVGERGGEQHGLPFFRRWQPPQQIADIGNEAEIEHAVARAGHQLDALVVQPMAQTGVELIVGVVHDHSFGPVLACGAGGTTAQLVSDVAVRITPVTDLEAREMVRSLRTFPLLDGYRGAPRCDLAAIEDVLLRVSAMVEAHPEIVELDCNPLIAGPDGVVIVDARVRVETAALPRPMPSLEA